MSGNEEADSLSVSEDSYEETDSLNVTVESNDGSLYIPTPQRNVRESIKNVEIVPSKVCSMDLKQLDEFIKRVNQIRCCATPGFKGVLSPIDVRSVGLGGAPSITYACNGCASQWALFKTLSKYKLSNATEISVAAQVAFIIAGCTHVTCYKVLKHALGIKGASWSTIYSTIERMYPVVKGMVDKMCDDAKDDMHATHGPWTKINLVHGVVLSRLLMARG